MTLWLREVFTTVGSGGSFAATVFVATAEAAVPEDFRTAEYLTTKGLDHINAADAYAQGYTGKGITLGVVDYAANFANPEFAGKAQ